MPATTEQFQALFDPKGVIVAGASSHPGKFGFVALHNILRNGYGGRVFATNLEGTAVLGIDTVASIDELPDGEADLVFVCTPAKTNIDLLRSCARKGVKAAHEKGTAHEFTSEEARAAGKTVIATCPFALSYIDRHPELDEFLRPSARRRAPD